MKKVTLAPRRKEICTKEIILLDKKNALQDSHGVSSLTDKESGIIFSPNKDKATLLNKLFQSVFS